MQPRTIHILVLDSTTPFRNTIQQAISSDAALVMLPETGADGNLEQAALQSSPDVVILNELSENGSVEARLSRLSKISSYAPCIVIGPGKTETEMAVGAHDAEFIKMPTLNSKSSVPAFYREICTKVRLAASAAAVMRMTAGNIFHQFSVSSSAASPASSISLAGGGKHFRYNLIAIGASTGGTEATAAIIQNLPAEMPPIVITQHMPPDFTRMYAERLDRISRLTVSEAKSGVRLLPGIAVVAAGGSHMYVKKDAGGYYIRSAPGEKVNGHCPSVGVTFDSVAECAGGDAIGVILTGMGSDGAEALLRMRQAGAFTVGQDQASCVVYGMPMVAYNIGAVMRQAPLDQIAGILVDRIH